MDLLAILTMSYSQIISLIRQLSVLQYDTLNCTMVYYFEIRQAISQ